MRIESSQIDRSSSDCQLPGYGFTRRRVRRVTTLVELRDYVESFGKTLSTEPPEGECNINLSVDDAGRTQFKDFYDLFLLLFL